MSNTYTCFNPTTLAIACSDTWHIEQALFGVMKVTPDCSYVGYACPFCLLYYVLNAIFFFGLQHYNCRHSLTLASDIFIFVLDEAIRHSSFKVFVSTLTHCVRCGKPSCFAFANSILPRNAGVILT
jgi:hypothetical protein